MTVFGGKAADTSPDAIPARTTPTWEMELLLSGATVFGLLQLPTTLTEQTEPLLARLGADLVQFAGMLLAYLLMALYALIGTFVLHLTIRGLWIAVVGMRSMFPEGPDFERLKSGPLARETMRRTLPSLDQIAERLDNRATTVFALGAITVVGLLMPVLMVLPALLVGLSGYPQWMWPTMLTVLFVLVAPAFVAYSIDQLWGRHIRQDSRTAQFLSAIMRLYQRLQPPAVAVLLTTLNTRIGTRKTMTMYLGALLLLSVVVVVSISWRRNGVPSGADALIPTQASNGLAILPEHYDDQRRGADLVRLVPYLDSAVLAGDWLRLVVPHDDGRVGDVVRRVCPPDSTAPSPPNVAATLDSGDQIGLLDCYAELLAVRVDGQLLKLRPEFHMAAESRIRGVIYMIDARDLGRGRHVVSIAQWPKRRNRDADTKPASWRIPFWK